jgi:hypothetical protein
VIGLTHRNHKHQPRVSGCLLQDLRADSARWCQKIQPGHRKHRIIMPQIIEVPGMGQVSFPDGMTDADISTAIQRNLPKPAGLDFSQPLTPDNIARARAARTVTPDTPSSAVGLAAQRAMDAETAAQNAPSMAPYWIAGGMVLFVMAFILLRKWLKSRPWRVIPQAVRSAAKMKDKMIFDLSDQDAEWLAAAEEELVSGNINKATWARALVKAGGNEEKRRVDYILLRVKRMRLGES